MAAAGLHDTTGALAQESTEQDGGIRYHLPNSGVFTGVGASEKSVE